MFATVTEGMDVVDRIKSVPTGARGPFAKDAPLEPVAIPSARRALVPRQCGEAAYTPRNTGLRFSAKARSASTRS